MRYSARALAVTALAGVALSGCGPGDELPEGWRWESYRDVEVAVPASWGHTSAYAQLDGCVGDPRPAVGRPAWAGSCGPWGGGEAGTDAAVGGTFVAFLPRARGEAGGDRAVRRLGDAVLVVQAPDDLRKRILATVRRISTDANGCAVRDPASARPDLRPEPADIRGLSGVTAVTSCLYRVARPFAAKPRAEDTLPYPPLVGSRRLVGRAAAEAVAAAAAAPIAGPVGTGQDGSRCSSFWGDQIAVLLVDSDQGRSRLLMRFSGCRHNGIDDGLARRELVLAGARPFVTGATMYEGMHGNDSGTKADQLLGPGRRLPAYYPPPEQP